LLRLTHAGVECSGVFVAAFGLRAALVSAASTAGVASARQANAQALDRSRRRMEFLLGM
jgi:hypothetical protein